MDDTTKVANLVANLRNRLEHCEDGTSVVVAPSECELLLVHLDGEPARLAAAKTEAADRAWDEAVKVTELEQAHVRLRAVAAREEQREALGISRWPVLVPFIAAMVRKLDANKPKKGGREGWSKDDPSALVRRVIDEAEELEHAVDTQPRGRIRAEAADVANMAMMVADASGALNDTPLTTTPPRGLRAERDEAVARCEVLTRAHAEVVASLSEAVAALRGVVQWLDTGDDANHPSPMDDARAVLAQYPEGR